MTSWINRLSEERASPSFTALLGLDPSIFEAADIKRLARLPSLQKASLGIAQNAAGHPASGRVPV
jgi:hypothetical protein